MPTVGLSMIVKNGGDDLRHCLNSVRGVVDQIVLADTGSTDNTIEIAKQFGAIVVQIPWADHYSDARNAALAPITTDWVLVLDADEELSPEAAVALPGLLAQTPETLGGYQLTIRNYALNTISSVLGSLARENTDTYDRAKDALAYSEHVLCRLFRRHPDFFFTGSIHEGVEQQIYDAGFEFVRSELRILHYGNLAETSGYVNKQQRYHKLLQIAVKEKPHLSHLWIQLAQTERQIFHNLDASLECARKAVALNPLEYNGWTVISDLLKEKGIYQDAIEALHHLPDTGDWAITKACSLGDNLHNLQRFKEARAMYCLALKRAKSGTTRFPTDFMGSVESRIGYSEVMIGMRKVGFRKLHHARDLAPMVIENHNRLMKAYIYVQDDKQAAETAEKTLSYIVSEQLFRRAVALLLRAQEHDRANRLIEAGMQRFPQSESLRAFSFDRVVEEPLRHPPRGVSSL
jgi:glycosyltransferase involved in cell wall biosynthesis